MSSSTRSSSTLSSSPLSSVASRSPSPPGDYPTPPSSNLPDAVPAPLRRSQKTPDRDGPPPAKRQKIMKPKVLKTERLDLQALNDSDDEAHHRMQDVQLRRLMANLRTKRKIVVIAGAGISVSAGIPDFRSADGLFKTLRGQHGNKSSGKSLFDASVYRDDNSTTSFHSMVRDLAHLTQKAEPTPFHHMIATLAEEGRLLRLYTQNVDAIDTSMEPLKTTVPLNVKGPWPKTIQLHGGLSKMVCSKCGHLADFDGSLFEGPEAPSCPECQITDNVRAIAGLRSHGIGCLRPRMVLYNEFNPDEDAIGACSAADLKSRPDAVIVVGTSLKVPGIRRLAKEMCSVTRGRRDGFTAWMNLDPEPLGPDFKNSWDLVVRGKCDEVARLVDLPKWYDKDCGEYVIVKDGEGDRKGSHAEVVLDLKPMTTIQTKGILTPIDSPRAKATTLPDSSNNIPKLKQPQLQFVGSAKSSPLVKDPPPKKKRSRKPLPSKPIKPANKITSRFGSTKITAPATEMAKLGEVSLPSTSQTQNSETMRPLSPFESRNNLDSFVPEIPETPPKSQTIAVEIPSYHETVSPKSVPRGMGQLLS